MSEPTEQLHVQHLNGQAGWWCPICGRVNGPAVASCPGDHSVGGYLVPPYAQQTILDKLADQQPMEIVYLIDESGSMAGQEKVVVDGFNEYVQSMKASNPEANLALVTFNSFGRRELRSGSIMACSTLTRDHYKPNGGTPLLDAIAYAIVSRTNSKKVIVVIMTDGQENSSKEFTRASLKMLIEQKTAKGWAFIYMGANQDAFTEAGSIGISMDFTSNLDTHNYSKSFGVMANVSRRYGSGGSKSAMLSQAEQNALSSTLDEDDGA